MSSHAFPQRFGQWALIVGASTGLGAAWAEECAKRGMDVIVSSRSRLDAAYYVKNIVRDIWNVIQVP